MALVANKKFLAVSFGSHVLIYDLTLKKCIRLHLPTSATTLQEINSKEKTDTESPSVSAIACSQSLKYFSVSDDDKQLYIYDTENEWSLLNSRTLPKRCTSMVFAKDSAILLADKSGDVNTFDVNDPSASHLLVVGHVSMLIDLCLCKNDKYLATCDRDEKIRVSHHPNGYNITAFCLGHLDYVSQLVFVEEKDLLISGSGDGTVRVWNYLSGQELDCFDCLPLVDSTANVKCPNLCPNQSDSENTCRGVDIRNIDYSVDLNLLAITFERRSGVLLLRLDGEKLWFSTLQVTPGTVLDAKLCNHLLVVFHLTSDECNVRVTCSNVTGLEGDRLQLSQDHGSSNVEGVDVMNEALQEYCSFVSGVKDWNKFNCSLHKMHIDNMSEYVDRKRQRMDESNTKRMKKQHLDDENCDNIVCS